jgi:hypothetical protein
MTKAATLAQKPLTADALERIIWERDHVRIVIREQRGVPLRKGLEAVNFSNIDFNPAIRIGEWRRVFVEQFTGDPNSIEVDIVLGNGESPNDDWLLRSVQDSYK